MQRGRRSKLDLVQPSATPTRTALSPVVRLSQLERSIFNLTVTRNPHLGPSDVVLLTAFARQAARVLRAGKLDGDAAIEKRTRIMVLLGRSLRLTPQSLTEPRTAARRRRDAQPSPIDEFFQEDDDDD